MGLIFGHLEAHMRGSLEWLQFASMFFEVDGELLLVVGVSATSSSIDDGSDWVDLAKGDAVGDESEDISLYSFISMQESFLGFCP